MIHFLSFENMRLDLNLIFTLQYKKSLKSRLCRVRPTNLLFFLPPQSVSLSFWSHFPFISHPLTLDDGVWYPFHLHSFISLKIYFPDQRDLDTICFFRQGTKAYRSFEPESESTDKHSFQQLMSCLRSQNHFLLHFLSSSVYIKTRFFLCIKTQFFPQDSYRVVI